MKRPILWTTIFMICGIYMRLGISKVICLVSFLFLLFFLFRFVINKKKPAYLLLLFFVPLGFFSAGVHWQAEQSLLTKTVTGEGVILEEGETTSGNQKLTLRCSLEKQEKPCKVYAVWVGEERFQEGERVAFSGEIVPFSKQSYPGGYDEQLYLLTKGYEYKLYPEKIKVTGQDTSLSVRLARARAGVQMVLDRILPAEESGLMQAVLTGDKEKIPEESYTLYSKAGVVHVLCISGLHLSILALYLAFFLEKALGRSKRTSALVTIFAVFAFLLFIKSSPSSYRAALMITVVLLGRAFYRLPDALNTMAIAAFLLLLFQPLYLFHAGFQLSFLTVFGIWFGIGRMERKKKKDRGKFDWLKESLLVSFYASLFSYPAVAYYFSSVSGRHFRESSDCAVERLASGIRTSECLAWCSLSARGHLCSRECLCHFAGFQNCLHSTGSSALCVCTRWVSILPVHCAVLCPAVFRSGIRRQKGQLEGWGDAERGTVLCGV